MSDYFNYENDYIDYLAENESGFLGGDPMRGLKVMASMGMIDYNIADELQERRMAKSQTKKAAAPKTEATDHRPKDKKVVARIAKRNRKIQKRIAKLAAKLVKIRKAHAKVEDKMAKLRSKLTK